MNSLSIVYIKKKKKKHGLLLYFFFLYRQLFTFFFFYSILCQRHLLIIRFSWRANKKERAHVSGPELNFHIQFTLFLFIVIIGYSSLTKYHYWIRWNFDNINSELCSISHYLTFKKEQWISLKSKKELVEKKTCLR